ncbi:hypothetical protein LJC52_04480, partial [Bacteroidales bacterium OttesenSCG-928-A17]|nr:hypothetical protein [Bacteroidales bacterium OttesenSCG-928-A17]
VKNIILFGFFMQMTWELAEQMLYGLWDDDDEKEKDIIKAAVISPISGLYMGSMAASAINGYKANPLIMFSEGEKRWRDIEKAYKNNGLFSPSVGIAAIKAMIQAGGINYNTWLNMYTAIEQAVENGDWNATNTYYFLNAPASVRKSFASKIKDNENILDYGSRVKDAHNRELETKELKALAKKKIFSDNGDMTDFNRLYALGKEWEKVRKAEKNLPEKSDLYKVLEKMNKNEALSKLYKMSDEIAGYYADYMRGDTIIPLMEEGIEQKRRQIHELIKEIKGNSK